MLGMKTKLSFSFIRSFGREFRRISKPTEENSAETVKKGKKTLNGISGGGFLGPNHTDQVNPY